MKALVISAFIFFCGTAANAMKQELVPVLEAGIYIGFQYDSVIPAPGFTNPFSWTLNITPTIAPSTFSHMKWNLLNTKTAKMALTEWRTLPSDNPRSLRLVLAQDRALYDFFPAHNEFRVVISANEKDIVYFISIAKVCEKYPAQVQDSTNTKNRSCRVPRSELPDAERECTEYRKEILGYNLSCELRKKMFEDAVLCGTWTCP